jgi:MYXO-CTERM domain-containing protein
MACVSPLGVYATDVKGGIPQGTSGSGSGGSTGTTPPTTPGPGAPGANGGGMTETTNGTTPPTAGCAVGGTPNGSPLAFGLLGALGLLLARRRR